MDLAFNQVLIAFLLASFAGLSTSFGAIIAFFSKSDNFKILSIGLGFSAGVMIYISFMEILPDAFENFSKMYDNFWGELLGIFCFFVGIVLCALVDKFVPEDLDKQRQTEYEELKNLDEEPNLQNQSMLKRAGILTAVVIAIHNFPEGFATFVSALDNLSFGVAIAIAIAIHNIPEGMAVSLPIYHATGNKKKAFVYSALSGLTEPLGALLGALFLLPFINEFVLATVFAVIAGIMVYISFDELLPAARVYGEAHHCLYGLLSGMGVMALSLAMLHHF
ncbi:zinc transporter ZupT [Campylobacter troglodytis]|uniref:zinc transporter ZupT n=1 Tax=Campylobacter troglodytis TaxID=654363 RepID=UPI0011570333|nr:zinc transporter ZupT [Campylobacter troglodytis]TQR60259.1 zinc transporter ZupT [Campylobacter troglodytis]